MWKRYQFYSPSILVPSLHLGICQVQASCKFHPVLYTQIFLSFKTFLQALQLMIRESCSGFPLFLPVFSSITTSFVVVFATFFPGCSVPWVWRVTSLTLTWRWGIFETLKYKIYVCQRERKLEDSKNFILQDEIRELNSYFVKLSILKTLKQGSAEFADDFLYRERRLRGSSSKRYYYVNQQVLNFNIIMKRPLTHTKTMTFQFAYLPLDIK